MSGALTNIFHRKFLSCFLFLISAQSFAAEIYVMMPLTKIQNWHSFREQLKTLKRNGVAGVTTDIWWGDFEARGDNLFDWDYYRQYAQVLRDEGLKWTPILSFHQCGGNVGDDCNVPLPSWVWQLGGRINMVYRDQNGFENGEYIAPWFGRAYEQYGEAFASFGDHFQDFRDIIQKVYISMGPAGELRYPSYNAASGWRYPEPGRIQAHSPLAIRSFQDTLRHKYGQSLDQLNRAWNSALTSWEQIGPPTDGDQFFRTGIRSAYGRDFMLWYQGSLLEHMKNMSRAAHENLLPKFKVKLGAKIAGLHWQFTNPEMPHSAEYATGYMEYRSILSAMRALNLELTFTCLELDENSGHPNYSSPQGLVHEVSTIAREVGVVLNGENALPIFGYRRAYENIRNNMSQFGFRSFTLLRLPNIVDSHGRETHDMNLFRDIVIRGQLSFDFGDFDSSPDFFQ